MAISRSLRISFWMIGISLSAVATWLGVMIYISYIDYDPPGSSRHYEEGLKLGDRETKRWAAKQAKMDLKIVRYDAKSRILECEIIRGNLTEVSWMINAKMIIEKPATRKGHQEIELRFKNLKCSQKIPEEIRGLRDVYLEVEISNTRTSPGKSDKEHEKQILAEYLLLANERFEF